MTDRVPDSEIDHAIDQEIGRLQKCCHSEGCAIGNLLQDGLEDLEGRPRLAMALAMLDELDGWARASSSVLTIVGDFLEPPLKEDDGYGCPGPGAFLPPVLDAAHQLMVKSRAQEELLREALLHIEYLTDDHEGRPSTLRMVEKLRAFLAAEAPGA